MSLCLLRVKEWITEQAWVRVWMREVGAWEWELVAEGCNTPTKAGLAQLQKLAWGDSLVTFGYLAVGSDDTAATEDQTALISEISQGRKAFTGHTVTEKQTNIQVYFAPHEAVGTIKEWGIFNLSAAGVMLCRGLVEPPKPKADTQEMIFEVILTLGAAS